MRIFWLPLALMDENKSLLLPHSSRIKTFINANKKKPDPSKHHYALVMRKIPVFPKDKSERIHYFYQENLGTNMRELLIPLRRN